MSEQQFEMDISSIQLVNHDQESVNAAKPDQYASRLNNLQKIQQKKRAVLASPYNKKLLKLAVYSKCQVRIDLFVYIYLLFIDKKL